MSLLGGHRVYFNYSKEKIVVRQNNEDLHVTRPVTKCVIQKGDDIIAESITKLYHKDVPNRIKAREYAFMKAIEKVEDRNTRKAIHSDFREKIKW